MIPAGELRYPDARAGSAPRFPADHGSHPDFRTEWWYLTGWFRDGAANDLGIQVTFFRHRPGLQEPSSSRFAPTQLLFAHAAIASRDAGRLEHAERSARAGFDLAEAATGNTDVHIGDWRLALSGDSYRAHVNADALGIDLECIALGPPLLQGLGGYSQKGPDPLQSSHYYSRPQLRCRGTLRRAGKTVDVSGTAWLDHEWSTQYLAPGATGWDWTGINLHDGGALMAFRIRDGAGAALWAGGSLQRAPGARTEVFGPDQVRFEALRTWTSPRTAARYPVSMRLAVPDAILTLEPLMDDQELDARGSTGTLYWEGAVAALRDGREVGRGYLELTGYRDRLRL